MAKFGRARYSCAFAAQRAALEPESDVGRSCDALRRYATRAPGGGRHRQLLAFGDGRISGAASDRGAREFVRAFHVDVRVAAARSVDDFSPALLQARTAGRTTYSRAPLPAGAETLLRRGASEAGLEFGITSDTRNVRYLLDLNTRALFEYLNTPLYHDEIASWLRCTPTEEGFGRGRSGRHRDKKCGGSAHRREKAAQSTLERSFFARLSSP